MFNETSYLERYFVKSFEQRFDGITSESKGKIYSTRIYNGIIPESDRKHTYTISLPVPKAGDSQEHTFKATTNAELWDGETETSNEPSVTITIKRNGKKETDFAIKDTNSAGGIITDRNSPVNDLNFSSPKKLYLESTSSIVGGRFTNYTWSVKRSNGLWQVFVNGASPNATFTLSQSNKSTYLVNGQVEFKLTTRDDANDTEESEVHFTGFYKPVPPKPADTPVALLKGKSPIDTGSAEEGNYLYARVGDAIRLDARESYATADGAKITDYAFTIPSGAKLVSDYSSNGKLIITFPYMTNATLEAQQTSTDSNGNSDTSDTLNMRVNPPELNLNLEASGSLKENRTVTVSVEGSEYPRFFPLDLNSLRYTVTALDGQANSFTTSKTMNGSETFGIQFHDHGRYKIDVYGEAYSLYAPNTPRVDDNVSLIVDVKEDQEPVIKFAVNNLTYRNPNNVNKARVDIENLSYSADNDILNPCYLYMYYDSDDDGFYADETRQLITSNLTSQYTVYIDKNRVGRVRFEVIGSETPNQPYIRWHPSFVKSASSDKYMAVADQVTLIDNIAPVVLLDAEKKESIQYLAITDKTGSAYSSFVSELNRLDIDLIQKNYDVERTLKKTDVLSLRSFTENKYVYNRHVRIHFQADDEEDDTPNHVWMNVPFPWESITQWETEPLPTLTSQTMTPTRLATERSVRYGKRSPYGYNYYNDYRVTFNGRAETLPLRVGYNSGASSAWGWWSDLRNEYAVLENHYTRGESVGTRTNTLKAIDLDKVKTHNWSDDSKKILIISASNAFSMAKTDEAFKQYIEDNDIQVVYSGDLDSIKLKTFDNGSPKEVFKEGSTYYIDTYEGIKYSYDPTTQDYPVQIVTLPEPNVETAEDRVKLSERVNQLQPSFGSYPRSDNAEYHKQYYPYQAFTSSSSADPYWKNDQYMNIPYISGNTLKVVTGYRTTFKDDGYRSYNATYIYKKAYNLASECKKVLNWSKGYQGVPSNVVYLRTDGKLGLVQIHHRQISPNRPFYNYNYGFYPSGIYHNSIRSYDVFTSSFNLSDVKVLTDKYDINYYYDDTRGQAWKMTSSGFVSIASGYSTRSGFRLYYEDGTHQLFDMRFSKSFNIKEAMRKTAEFYYGLVEGQNFSHYNIEKKIWPLEVWSSCFWDYGH